MTLKWTQVCHLEEILPNTGCCALHDQQQVAIFRIEESEELYAVQNYDPLGEANVLSRGILGDLNGELVVASPLYKHHYSLKTGKCLEDESVQLQTFPIRVENGRVELGSVSLN